MNRGITFLRRHGARLAAVVLIVGAFNMARLPEASASERSTLASRFSFTRSDLAQAPSTPARSMRDVNPSFANIAGWISSVGASVALADLDGDGLPNDVCAVDPRSDKVIVSPAPGTPARYEPFVLDPSPLPFDSATMAPAGCLPGDFNEDGLTSLLVYFLGRTPIIYLRIPGTEMTAAGYLPRELVTTGERWFTTTATTADLDGDGHVDLVLGNYFPDGSRILDPRAAEPDTMQESMSRAFNGGGPRFFRWVGATAGREPTVQFEEAKGVLQGDDAHGWPLAIAAADLDGDLLPEIYVANDFGPDLLLHNRSTPGHIAFTPLHGERTFTTPASKVVGHDSFKGMGVDFADLDARGLLDFFVTNITDVFALEESNLLFHNTGELDRMKQGIAPFVDRSESLGVSRAGWGWDVKMADFDNSTNLAIVEATGFVQGSNNRWPELQELATANPTILRFPWAWPKVAADDDVSGHNHNPFWVRGPNERFVNIAAELGIGEDHVSRGIAIADVDGSGRLDFAVANQWGPSTFYRNECPHCGAFLGLHLLLPVNSEDNPLTQTRTGHPGSGLHGRPAIGATATITLPDGRRRTAQIDGGNGHSGRRSPDLHFGLGDVPADAPITIDVQWRGTDGRVHHDALHLAPGWHTVLLGENV